MWARSIHRPQDPCMPTISVGWHGDRERFILSNRNLEEYSIFKLFDKNHVEQNLLPPSPISFRNSPGKSVDGKYLSILIDQLLDEIMQKNKRYTNFTILQNKGFNRRKACGLLIVKFNDYPFVVKLFIETPKSFVNPWAKGFEPIFFFYMGGGVNRHLSGFTRIKNLMYIKQRIASDPQWSNLVDVPRKWFWLPDTTSNWLEIMGTNIGGKQALHTHIPGIYAIVADAIDAERTFSSLKKGDLDKALGLTNFLHANLDLHITNFMVEKETKKIVIIDTEHFPTMVGLKEPKTFSSYLSWYTMLMGKCAEDMLFSTKQMRRDAQSINVSTLAPFASIDLENQASAQHAAQPC